MKHTRRHEPPHLYSDDIWYFITASIYKGAHYLASDRAKALLLKKFGPSPRKSASYCLPG
jgi:hypothetical protein